MYLQKEWTYGNRIEVKKYHTFRYGVKGEKRGKRKNPTAEQIREANNKRARKKLKRLMINNFDLGDWHLTLTYSEENRPDVMESKKCLKKFWDIMRREYRKAGTELRFIVVTEWESTRIHHHIAINDVPGFATVIRKAWPYGGAHLTPLYENYDYEGLADYFVKETEETYKNENNPYKQRWSCSRNLKKPVEETKIVKADSWRKEPKITKKLEGQGYRLDMRSLYVGVDAMGYPFQTYQFVREEGRNRIKRQRRQQKKRDEAA